MVPQHGEWVMWAQGGEMLNRGRRGHIYTSIQLAQRKMEAGEQPDAGWVHVGTAGG